MKAVERIQKIVWRLRLYLKKAKPKAAGTANTIARIVDVNTMMREFVKPAK
jgi:hypothetical protein